MAPCTRSGPRPSARCADDLIRLARTVYGIDLTRGRVLSVRDLANTFAAFRWGGLLKAQDCSAMEFPYSVAGLTEHHLGMRWPRITVPGTGDRPGSRFRRPFGAVPDRARPRLPSDRLASSFPRKKVDPWFASCSPW